MLAFIAAIGLHLTAPYFELLKRELAKKKFASLTLLHGPNLIGHPIFIIALLALGLFQLPRDPEFFLWWAGLVALSAIELTLVLRGLLRSSFFAVQALARVEFAVTAVLGVILLGERIDTLQAIALLLATASALIFLWPKYEGGSIIWDRGLLLTLLAIFLTSFGSILYKYSSELTASYSEFLTGRIIGDLAAWTLIWLGSLYFLGRKPLKELWSCWSLLPGKLFLLGSAALNLVDSWLVFALPISTVAMLSTLAIPASYFIGQRADREPWNPRQIVSGLLILIALLLFVWPR